MPAILLVTLTLLVGPAALAATPGPAQLEAGLVNPGHHQQPAWFKPSFLDIREDVFEARDQGKRVVLYFYQDGCPYCAKLLQDNLGDRSIAEAMREHFDVIAINLWGDREVTDFDGELVSEKRFAAGLRVQFTPTLLFLNEDGQVVVRINGYFRPHKFAAVVDYVGGRHETESAFAEFLAARRPQAASGRLHPVAESLPAPLQLAENRAESERPLLVLFEQKACRDCDELHRDIFQRRAVAIALTNLDIAQLDLRADRPVTTPDGTRTTARDWARRLDIQYAPSLVFFDGEGEEVFRTEAYLKSFHIHGAIDYVVSGAYEYQPNFQRFLQRRREELEARGIEVDLMD